jgi:hypothetical protein
LKTAKLRSFKTATIFNKALDVKYKDTPSPNDFTRIISILVVSIVEASRASKREVNLVAKTQSAQDLGAILLEYGPGALVHEIDISLIGGLVELVSPGELPEAEAVALDHDEALAQELRLDLELLLQVLELPLLVPFYQRKQFLTLENSIQVYDFPRN